MTFSVYSSMKSIPREMKVKPRKSTAERLAALHATGIRLIRPSGTVWNSMMERGRRMAFPDAVRNARAVGQAAICGCPGPGSYLHTAANAEIRRAIPWGVFAAILVIVLMDR